MQTNEGSDLPVRPHHMYVEDVRLLLTGAGLMVSLEWWEAQQRRVELHRQMGLTPPQSAEELRPFAEGARRRAASWEESSRRVIREALERERRRNAR
jgi:hypothetical protein